MADKRRPLYSFWAPRYWFAWLGLALLWLICLLPHRAGLFIGSGIGRLAFQLSGSRRGIVRRNIELCFPGRTVEDRERLLRSHFRALGMSLIEMGLGRFASDRRLYSMCNIEGLEHLEAAVKDDRGVIMLAAHFTTLEISGRALKPHIPEFDAVYRKGKSDFVTELQRTGREVTTDSTIEKRDIKRMVRNLKAGRLVWYAPDQSYNRKGAELIEFFGVPCMHTTATSTLARLGNALVLPFFQRRESDRSYTLIIGKAFDNFPSGDPIDDTNRYVRALEQHVVTCPEQYLWLHRKFKNLPDGYPDYYADLDASK